MKALLTVLAVSVMSAALPNAAHAWQIELDPSVLSDVTDNQRVTHCQLLLDGNGVCEESGEGAHFTLRGRMDLQLLAEGELRLNNSGMVDPRGTRNIDVVGVLVGCKICMDGSCAGSPAAASSQREAGPTFFYAPAADASTFETYFFINGSAGNVAGAGALPGPDAYNSYSCGLWLHATQEGTDLLVMPNEFYDPADGMTRFAKTQGAPVVELSGPLR